MGAMVPRLLVRRTLGLGFASAAGVGGLSAAYVADERVKRSLCFWWSIAPIYLHYRWVAWWLDSKRGSREWDEVFTALHERHAPVAERVCLDLRGLYLKTAQFYSMLSTDFVPPQYMVWMRRMQDEVPTPYRQGEAEAAVERALGRSLEEVFEHWEPEPCGSASIGQVHRARLRHPPACGGDVRDVAVKVMYPGIEKQFRSDLETLKLFIKIARPQELKIIEEIEAQFLTEFDYVLEAQNLRRVHDNVMPRWSHLVKVPQPVDELCRPEVLVMEYVPGVKLVDGLRRQWRTYAAQHNTTLEALEAEFKTKVERGELQRRTPEEEARDVRRMARLLALRDRGCNALRAVYNWTFGLLPLVQPLEYTRTEVPFSLGEVLQRALAVHAHEILMDGTFNGDPHPGNILLMPDGRLGLIDYGQVKHICLEKRLNYAKLIVAINNDDREEIVRVQRKDIGIKSKYQDNEVLYKLSCFWNDRETEDILQGRHLVEFLDQCEAQDPLLYLDADYVMVSRVVLMLRGLASAFFMQMRVTDYWRPCAEQLLRDHGVPFKERPRAADAQL